MASKLTAGRAKKMVSAGNKRLKEAARKQANRKFYGKDARGADAAG